VAQVPVSEAVINLACAGTSTEERPLGYVPRGRGRLKQGGHSPVAHSYSLMKNKRMGWLNDEWRQGFVSLSSGESDGYHRVWCSTPFLDVSDALQNCIDIRNARNEWNFSLPISSAVPSHSGYGWERPPSNIRSIQNNPMRQIKECK